MARRQHLALAAAAALLLCAGLAAAQAPAAAAPVAAAAKDVAAAAKDAAPKDAAPAKDAAPKDAAPKDAAAAPKDGEKKAADDKKGITVVLTNGCSKTILAATVLTNLDGDQKAQVRRAPAWMRMQGGGRGGPSPGYEGARGPTCAHSPCRSAARP